MSRALSQFAGALVLLLGVFSSGAGALTVSGGSLPPVVVYRPVTYAVVNKLYSMTDIELGNFIAAAEINNFQNFDIQYSSASTGAPVVGSVAFASDFLGLFRLFSSQTCMTANRADCGLLRKNPQDADNVTGTSYDGYATYYGQFVNSVSLTFPEVGAYASFESADWAPCTSADGLTRIWFTSYKWYGSVNGSPPSMVYRVGWNTVRRTSKTEAFPARVGTRDFTYNDSTPVDLVGAVTAQVHAVCKGPPMTAYFRGEYAYFGSSSPQPHPDLYAGWLIAFSQLQGELDRTRVSMEFAPSMSWHMRPTEIDLGNDACGGPCVVPPGDGTGTPGTGTPGATPTTCLKPDGSSTSNQFECAPKDEGSKCSVLDIPCNLKYLFVPREEFFKTLFSSASVSKALGLPVQASGTWTFTLFGGQQTLYWSDVPIPQELKTMILAALWFSTGFWVMRWLGMPVPFSPGSGGRGLADEAGYQFRNQRGKGPGGMP